jgi:hypothetical protein
MKFKFVVIPPEDQPYVLTVDTDETTTLHALQGLVGGNVDCIQLWGDSSAGLDIWFHDEALWHIGEEGYEPNPQAVVLLWGLNPAHYAERTVLFGTAVLALQSEGETIGLNRDTIEVLKEMGVSIAEAERVDA